MFGEIKVIYYYVIGWSGFHITGGCGDHIENPVYRNTCDLCKFCDDKIRTLCMHNIIYVFTVADLTYI